MLGRETCRCELPNHRDAAVGQRRWKFEGPGVQDKEEIARGTLGEHPKYVVVVLSLSWAEDSHGFPYRGGVGPKTSKQ